MAFQFRTVVGLMLGLIVALPAPAGQLRQASIHSPCSPDKGPDFHGTAIDQRLALPQGGRGSSMFVYVSDKPLQSLDVTVGPPRRVDSGASLPPASVLVRYAVTASDLSGRESRAEPFHECLTLSETFIPGQRAQPVWFTFQIPADAEPGRYRSRLTIGDKATIVEVQVYAFRMPPKTERLTMLSFMQSADTVALRYGVKPYSAEHFTLLDRSLYWQGVAGGNVLTVPIVGNDIYGTRTGMIQFRRKEEGLAPDFTAFERYLALFVKYCGPPRAAIAHLFETGWYRKPETNSGHDQQRPPLKLHLTEVTASGEFKPLTVDPYPANETLWKAVLDGMATRLEKAGTPRHAVRLGEAMQVQPPEEVLGMFTRIAADLGWAAWSYREPGKAWPSGTMSLMEVAGCVEADTDQGGPRGGWGDELPILAHPFGWFRTFHRRQVRGSLAMHVWFEQALIDRRRAEARDRTPEGWRWAGWGKVGLDFWTLPRGKDSRGKPTLFEDGLPLWDPEFQVWNRNAPGYTPLALTTPGPRGAMATGLLELLAEGVQEAEIRCHVERAITSGTLPAEFADYYSALQRYDLMAESTDRHAARDPARADRMFAWFGLKERGLHRLLALAAAVQQARGKSEEKQ